MLLMLCIMNYYIMNYLIDEMKKAEADDELWDKEITDESK